MGFTPANPEFESRVRDSFARQQVMATLGAHLVRVSPGEVDIEMPFRSDLTQQHGYLHAGIIATVLDSACGYAAFSLMSADATVLSVEFKTNLLAPAAGETFLARGRVLRSGRTITVCEAAGVMLSGSSEKAVAHMVGTMMTLHGKDDR
jgi:uncharacterized protein (TIGR00369 family)